MIATTILFGIIATLATGFLIIGILKIGEEFYFDVISLFIASTIFLLLGFQSYVSVDEFEFMGLLLIVLGIITALYGVIRIFDIAFQEFGLYSDEFTRDANYEYK